MADVVRNVCQDQITCERRLKVDFLSMEIFSDAMQDQFTKLKKREKNAEFKLRTVEVCNVYRNETRGMAFGGLEGDRSICKVSVGDD